jgi:hypothetical protein
MYFLIHFISIECDLVFFLFSLFFFSLFFKHITCCLTTTTTTTTTHTCTQLLKKDEPTAHIDPTTDAALQRIIRKEFKNSTLLTIAHRLHTVADFDKVYIYIYIPFLSLSFFFNHLRFISLSLSQLYFSLFKLISLYFPLVYKFNVLKSYIPLVYLCIYIHM